MNELYSSLSTLTINNCEMKENQESLKTFKQEFQKARMNKKMTQEALAKALNINEGVIRNIEFGSLFPNPLLLSRINQVLNSNLKKNM